jgi:hypothetical protein
MTAGRGSWCFDSFSPSEQGVNPKRFFVTTNGFVYLICNEMQILVDLAVVCVNLLKKIGDSDLVYVCACVALHCAVRV